MNTPMSSPNAKSLAVLLRHGEETLALKSSIAANSCSGSESLSTLHSATDTSETVDDAAQASKEERRRRRPHRTTPRSRSPKKDSTEGVQRKAVLKSLDYHVERLSPTRSVVGTSPTTRSMVSADDDISRSRQRREQERCKYSKNQSPPNLRSAVQPRETTTVGQRLQQPKTRLPTREQNNVKFSPEGPSSFTTTTAESSSSSRSSRAVEVDDVQYSRRKRSTSIDVAESSHKRIESSRNGKRDESRKARSLSRDRSTVETTSSSPPEKVVRKGTRPVSSKPADPSLERSDHSPNTRSHTSTLSPSRTPTKASRRTHTASSSRSLRRNPTREKDQRSRDKRGMANPSRPADGIRPTLRSVEAMNSELLLQELSQMNAQTLKRLQAKIKTVNRARSLSPTKSSDESSRRRKIVKDALQNSDKNEGVRKGHGRSSPARTTRQAPKRRTSRQNADLSDAIISMSFLSSTELSPPSLAMQPSPDPSPRSKAFSGLQPPSLKDFTLSPEEDPNADVIRLLSSSSGTGGSQDAEYKNWPSCATPIRSNVSRQAANTKNETSPKGGRRYNNILAKSKGLISQIRANIRSEDKVMKSHQCLPDFDDDDSECMEQGDQQQQQKDSLRLGAMIPNEENSDDTWGGYDPTSQLMMR